MLLLRRPSLCSFLLLSCLVISCGQEAEINKLIGEINSAKVKSLKLGQEGETKRVEAKEKLVNGKRGEYEKLMDEAANLYGQASDLLNQSANKAEQIAKQINPYWYKEYFTLQSKLLRNLASLASGAHEELLVRKSGEPSEEQLKSWKDNISGLRKERAELDKEIAKLESEHGLAPTKRE